MRFPGLGAQLPQLSLSLNDPPPDSPLVVSYGVGVDSTAMLIEMYRRSIRPDLILFADVGEGEKPETYAYIPIMKALF